MKRFFVGVGRFVAGYLLTALVLVVVEMVLVTATDLSFPTGVIGLLALVGGFLMLSRKPAKPKS